MYVVYHIGEDLPGVELKETIDESRRFLPAANNEVDRVSRKISIITRSFFGGFQQIIGINMFNIDHQSMFFVRRDEFRSF